MKLTNVQLEILADSIYKKVEEKKKTILDSTNLEEIMESLKESFNYNQKISLSEQYFDLKAKIEALQEEQSNLSKDIDKICGTGRYLRDYMITAEAIDSNLRDQAIQTLLKDLPTEDEIKAEIVLATIEGKEDLLTSICSKFSL